MRVRLFTLRYSSTLGGFDDGPLREFCRDKDMLSFREHFFAVNEVPHLACVVTYQIAPVQNEEAALCTAGTTTPQARRAQRPREDPAAGLTEPDRLLFNSLREWRADTARDEGVPPYVVLTNRELRAVVEKRPDSRTALGHVPGIGPAKIKRYGSQILRHLHGGDDTGRNGNDPEGAAQAENRGTPA